MGIQNYSHDEIKQKVFVPAIVEQEIRQNISGILDKCGIFYRVFSRIKSASSLAHKFSTEKYGTDKKIQDLVGIRINLYFQDDIEICKELIEEMYELAEPSWSTTESSDSNFEAAKINGVFHLPEFLIRRISPQTWDMAIDRTFEIQIKTVLFEGWHEVEHDFRYKLKSQKFGAGLSSIWDEYPTMSRQLNSIVATLELCDNSLVTICENLGHDLYKNQEWENMLRLHFRVRLSDEPLYEGISDILSQNSSALGKKLYKCKRKILMHKLFYSTHPLPLSVNMIIMLLNKEVLDNNQQINRILKANDVFKTKSSPIKYQNSMQPLTEHRIFQIRNELRLSPKYSVHGNLFSILQEHFYSWAHGKYERIFPDMPSPQRSFAVFNYGYHVKWDICKEEGTLAMEAVHIDLNYGGQLWKTTANIKPNEKKNGFYMTITNSILNHEDPTASELVSRFSYPRFYSDIYSDPRITVFDKHRYMLNPARLGYGAALTHFAEFLLDNQRFSPVVLVISDNITPESSALNEEWIGKNWLNNIAKSAHFYTHMYRGSVEEMQVLADHLKLPIRITPGVYFFAPGEAPMENVSFSQELHEQKMKVMFSPQTLSDREPAEFMDSVHNWVVFRPEYINDCRYYKYRYTASGIKTDRISDGARAFLFKIIDMIKEINQFYPL